MQLTALRPTRRALRAALTAVALTGAAVALVPAVPATAAGRQQPDLAVSLMTTDLLNPAIGETFYTSIDIRNYGTGDAAPMTVTVSVPAELRPESAGDPGAGWTCTTGTSSWTCSYPALAAGARANRLSLPSTVIGGQPGSLVSVDAAIKPQRQESYQDNNTASTQVEIAGTCVIRGTVWQDLDADGQRDADEPPVAGGPDGVVGVSLFVRGGQVIGGGQASVAPDGTWSITARTGALYEVRVEAASTFSLTTADLGDDATDSDIIHFYQQDPTLLGGSAEFDPTPDAEYVVDAGLVARA
ncbi:hypothetical protein DLE60_19785 [Micromonospora globispora]|uniref:SdrD B-like domain-containing protein n=1 Tax=Micromonospora globispora TaxID=1450148 RepID=UPI000D6FA762|nr:SdrD B-like domain-containing protein [Micromonospora globispora]PWU58798.1 hypothetical protein DLE60_19785 [Micromonospora globispora]